MGERGIDVTGTIVTDNDKEEGLFQFAQNIAKNVLQSLVNELGLEKEKAFECMERATTRALLTYRKAQKKKEA